MYYIPSIQKDVLFNELTIGQFKTIYNNAKNYFTFNIGFCNTLINNCTESINLTNFDKEVLLLQIHLKEIKNTDIIKKQIQHPKNEKIQQGLYDINIIVPDLKKELEFCNFVMTLSNYNKNILLLSEITKHINSLILNNTKINLDVSFKDAINVIKKLPPHILAECIQKIDTIKKQVKDYYILNKVPYNYNISLLVP